MSQRKSESNMYPKISIHIVAWNSMQFIPDLLASIQKQTFQDFQVLIIDNGSSDGLESFVQEKYPQVRFLRNARNLGFSGAHNQGMRYAIEHWGQDQLEDKFILVTNPDILFTPSYLEELVRATKGKEVCGTFGGKLLRAYGEGLSDEVLKETVHSDRIDSTGLRFHKNFTFTDRGAGEMDEGQYDEQEEVFGLSGALVLYRALALQSVRYRDEFFDHDFFAYKEDVDMAFKMQYAGWQTLYVPKAVAYHYRGMYGQEKMGFFARIKNRKNKSLHRSYYSTRNHWLLLLKELDVVSFFVLFPRLFFAEMSRCFYVLFFETKNSRAFLDAIRLVPRIWAKRGVIQKTKIVPGRLIRKKFAE
jgi:GT2 family glycosyltransferase